MSHMYRLAIIDTDEGAKIVVENGGHYQSLTAILPGEVDRYFGNEPTDLMPVLENWAVWNSLISAYVDTNHARFPHDGTSVDGVRFLAPLKAPGKIVCIGSNYHDHIAEMPIPMVPSYPYSFLKPANNTIRATGDAVAIPKQSQMMDWEAELAVIIGAECRDVKVVDALDYVAGYANFNDLSARDWLASRPPIGVDWVQHKAFDGFAPMGPYILPSQFVAEPQNLPVRLMVNNVVKQDSNTSEMVYGVAQIIEHLAAIMTLYPGDVIATGTPAGVGHGRNPPEYLNAGDEVRMEIGDLGELVTPII